MRFFLILFLALSAMGLHGAGRVAWKESRPVRGPGYDLASKRFIVLPPDAGDALVAAAADLAMVLEARFGRAPEVVRTEWRRMSDAFYLGDVAVAGTALRPPEDLEAGGFVIHWRGSRIFVRGRSEAGTVNGVYALAGDRLGARWYWPDPLGFDLAPPEVSGGDLRWWREEPAYQMRWMYPLGTDVEMAFGRRNRLVRRFEFNHALSKVFTEATHAAHPEAFAEIGGERKAPAGSGKYDPQPDFTSEAAVAIAADAAIRHFRKHPESNSFSLSINDNVLFDEGAATRAAVSPLRYFRDRPVYTDLVFGFMNRVAERVFEGAGLWTTASGAPRYLTALSYYWTEAAPTIGLHPRVMPVLTADRAQWHDPSFREEERALIPAWGASGPELVGTWDYYFGAPYPYPRQFNRWIGESIPFMREAGVRVFFSQLPSAWGLDGCKAWLASRLLWDPDEDWRALVDEYYTVFFGAAAEPLRRFYEKAEARRNARAGPANWIKFYKDESGIELFPPSFCAGLRAEIEAAKAAVADDPLRRERVEVVSEAFSFTEAYSEFHHARLEMVRAALAVLRDGEGDPDRVSGLIAGYLDSRAQFYARARALVKRPEHQRLSTFLQSWQSDPLPLALAALVRAAPPSGDPAELLSADVLSLDGLRSNLEALRRWKADPGSVEPVLYNGALRWDDPVAKPRSFLGPPVPQIEGWDFGFRPSERFAIETIEAGGSEPASSPAGVHLSGADVVSFFAMAPVGGAEDYLLRLRCAWRVSPDNRSSIRIDWYGAEGTVLANELPLNFPNGSGAEQDLLVPLRAPEGSAWVRISLFISRQYPGDFFTLREVGLGRIGGER